MRTTLRRLLSTLGAVALVTTFVTASPGASAEAADTTPPVLSSMSVPAGPYVPGQQVTWTLDVLDASPIRWIQLYYATPGAEPGSFMAEFEPPEDWRGGPLRWTMPGTPGSAPHNGQYEATVVWIHDRAGNSANYYVDGRLRTNPATATTHAVDIRSPLSVINSPRDVTPPVLEAFKASTSVTSAEAIGMEYTARDATQHRLKVYGRRDGGDEELLAERVQTAAQGILTYRPSSVGIIDLTKVVVSDVNSNSATYLANGTFTTSPASSPTPASHPFAIGRIKVLPTPAEIGSLRPLSGGAELSWTQTPTAGHRITIQPEGRVITGGPELGQQYRTVKLTGLQNGVAHTITVTPTSSAGDGTASTKSVTPRMTMKVFGTGDRSGDRRADVWATGFGEATSDERWRLYTGTGAGAFGKVLHPVGPYGIESGFPGSATGRGPGAPLGALALSVGDLMQPMVTGGATTVGHGFNVFRTIDASSDLTGDGIADVIGITPAGDFYLYPSTSSEAIGRGARLGGGWGTFHAVFSPGDFNGDGRSDVVGVDSLGKLWLYPGNGRGGFGARLAIGSGWGGFGSVLPLRDFSGDGKVDLGAITFDGKLIMYPGNGRGGFLAAKTIGTGWSVYL